MLTLYDNFDSGNGYKVRLLLALLGQPYRWVNLDIDRGETHTPEFLAKNPNGRIPTIELEDGTCLAESDAILWYLADGTRFLPEEKLARAQVLQWMFFEQYSHEPYVAVARSWHHLPAMSDEQKRQLPDKMKRGYAALDVMETHLASRQFFVGETYGLADVALYAYTHVAGEGGFDLSRYPAIGAWMKRVADQPNHIPITAPAGTAARDAS